MNKTILCDCDGVVADWVGGFEEWLKETHDRELEPESEGVYKVEYRIPGVTSVEGAAFVEEFNRSDYIGRLAPFRDAQEYVAKLHSEGFVFHVITAIEDTPEIYERRLKNLTDLYGSAISKLTLVGDIPNKIHHLTKYRDTGRFWIEDSIGNAKDGHELGLETILVKHGHSVNFTHDDIHPIETWAEIYEIISE